MNKNDKKELIKKLSETKENLDMLRGILKDEKWKVEQKAKLVNKSLGTIAQVLYKLTGNDFYLNTRGGEMKIIENLLTLGKKNRPGNKIKELRALVIHWVEVANQLPVNTRSWWEKGEVYGSAHYIIGTDGAIMQTLPEDEIGHHVGSVKIDPASQRVYTDKARAMFGENVCDTAMNNYYSIGIELEHLNMEPGDFSEATLLAAAELCAGILKRHNKTVDILTTHHEAVGWKDCPRLWTNNPALFEEFKARVKILLEAV